MPYEHGRRIPSGRREGWPRRQPPRSCSRMECGPCAPSAGRTRADVRRGEHEYAAAWLPIGVSGRSGRHWGTCKLQTHHRCTAISNKSLLAQKVAQNSSHVRRLGKVRHWA
eukprot:364254-Chlamydomonas_euryale.AAC.16